jgi:NAD(P)-dependent dehydrogenase (short-subunit alcohol dehydrogenase family)
MKNKNIIITGGNKGIGFGLVKKLSEKHNIIFTVRSEEKGQETLNSLLNVNKTPKYVVMDVTSSSSVNEGFEMISKSIQSVDILINNAGILIPGLKYNISAIETNEDDILKTFNTNTMGVLRVIRSSVPLMEKGSMILNISSGMGQLDDMGTGSTAYRLSKTALNALTVILASELKSKNISVNAICPGWVQTDMGGKNAELTVGQSVKKIIEFIFSNSIPTGKFLRHGKILRW